MGESEYTMKEKMFTASTIAIETANGKIQWNTSTPEFRAAMQFRYDGLMKLSDRRAVCSDAVAGLRKAIKATESLPYYSSETIDGYNAQIAALNAEVKAIDDEIRANTPAYTEIDENLYWAYRAYMRGTENAESGNTYERAFQEWCHANGIVPTTDTFKFITAKIGCRKLGAKAVVKSNGEELTDALTKNPYLDLFYRLVMQCMKKANCLRPYEFQYTAPEKNA